MFASSFSHSMPFWWMVTRLGEAQILLPAGALAVWAVLPATQGRRLALSWFGLLAAAVLLTTATKVAFIGWGLGWQALDFTGISGHAMFAAAVYPLALPALLPAHRLRWRIVALLGGAGLATLVGISRVKIGAHSLSETVAGLVLGAAVVLLVLSRLQHFGADVTRPRLRPWMPALAAGWFALTPLLAPASQTHPMVTRLALALAGHQQPYLREPWLREWRLRHPRVL